MTDIIPLETIERRILLIRRHKVMIDADLAAIYGVTTKRLNEQVKRNKERFPEDFMFQLTEKEKMEVVAICDHLKKLKYSPVLPSRNERGQTPKLTFHEGGDTPLVCL
jgi:hypothetical protein